MPNYVRRNPLFNDARRLIGRVRYSKRKTLDRPRREPKDALNDAAHVPAPSHVELWAPVGDRDRMLLLAEKAVELGASVWRPIVYQRSRSVTPRGEGDAFREKTRLRMIGALEQSGSAWMPDCAPESSLEAALRSESGLDGVLLDVGGAPLATLPGLAGAHIALALGPEGGLTDDERASFSAAGWRTASLGTNVLRFETAGIAALAMIRALTT